MGLFAALLAFSIAPIKEVDEIAWEHGYGQDVVARRAAEPLLRGRISTSR